MVMYKAHIDGMIVRVGTGIKEAEILEIGAETRGDQREVSKK